MHTVPVSVIRDIKQKMAERIGFAKADTQILKFLHSLYGDDLENMHEATQRRLAFLRKLRDYAEDGWIAVIESGRDCDGVRYWGKVRLIPATVAAYNEFEGHVAAWADGPFHLALERPSVAKRIKYGSVDLGMQAFEDGHAHVIYDSGG